MKFLSVVTPPPAIYHGCSTRKMFWEEKFTLVNMKSCGRRNVRKHSKINNVEKYIILDISSNIYCLDKREVNYLYSKYYIRRPGKGLTTYLYLRTKGSNKKQKARFFITD